VRHLEIPYGAFERRISLPNGRFEADAPQLTHGCLLLRLRRIG
jgi:HSP20 family protein